MFQLFLQIINIIKIGNIRTDWYRKLYMKTSDSPKFSLILTIFLVIFWTQNVFIPQRAKISQVAKCANILTLYTTFISNIWSLNYFCILFALDFCIKTKITDSSMITDNSIQKYIQLISMFSESLWSCSNMKIRLIYQIPLEI